MNVRPSLVLLAASCLGLSGLLTFGCGGQTTPGYSSEGKDASCNELCEKSSECNSDVEVADCTETCTTNEVVSRAGQDLVTGCSASQECEEIGDLETLECIEDGLFDLPINQAQEHFCTITLGKLAECSQTPLGENDVDNCLSGIALISDEFVTELAECGERTTCDLVNFCAGLKILTAIDEDQLEAILGGNVSMGELGGLGSLGDLLGSLGDAMGNTAMGGSGPD